MLIKRERLKKKIHSSSAEARSDVFEYIEMFYNSKLSHGSNGLRSPLDYEKKPPNALPPKRGLDVSRILVAIQRLRLLESVLQYI